MAPIGSMRLAIADPGYAGIIESGEPVVIQHARLGSRRAGLALLTTIAFAQA